LGGRIATATVEGHAAALIVSLTATGWFCTEFSKISNPLFDPQKMFRHVEFTHLMVTLKFG
jgi:hypothetical protein